VTFTDKGDGTATLAGTPAAGSGGTYTITLGAKNGVTPDASQSFTLTVNQAPAITSASSTAFTTGTARTFHITTTGFPTPTMLTESGKLPAGVTFKDNGNGKATLAGTPAAGSVGTYKINLGAKNGVTPDASQSFTLTVDQAPAFTSASAFTFVEGAPGSFAVKASGFPVPTLKESGELPSGVSFNISNGTLTLSGTPALGSAKTYPLIFTASNGVGTDARQSFTLTVTPAPPQVKMITGVLSPRDTALDSVGVTLTEAINPASFTSQEVTLTLNGVPVPLNSAVQVLSPQPGASPAIYVISGLAAFTTPPGNYVLTVLGSGLVGPTGVHGTGSSSVPFMVTAPLPPTPLIAPPVVTLLSRHGIPHATQIVLTFNEPLDPFRAGNLANYGLVSVRVGGRFLRRPIPVALASATYSPTGQSVTLTTRKKLDPNQGYALTVNGNAPGGLSNFQETLLDGSGPTGSDFVGTFNGRNGSKAVPPPGFDALSVSGQLPIRSARRGLNRT
jgi:hypothetical protein